jgi:hypothetical protein
MLVVKMQMKSEINHKLAAMLSSGVINFPDSKHTAGRVQYATRGIDVHGYTVAFM